ncbi:PAS domain-containing protein [Hymenobacter sp. BT175]|uniref:ATP-binding protein n=1 Tax=Hymenobacter translucens TaxID=2886507 RepID=UPI001D0EB4AE|nr:ATP-binding protein [Hymenobacter translucens]MCC2548276.1 PAS domain-containing protein [Hymenobacter translucens]
MADSRVLDAAALARENEELRHQLLEAEELITAIRTGAVDALAVQGVAGTRIFTLEGADQEYRTLIEQMNEGALLLSPDATVLYCNACLAGLLARPLEEVIGSSFTDFVPPAFRPAWQALLDKGWAGKGKGELPLQTKSGSLLPFSLAMNVLTLREMPALAVIVTDLSAEREIEAIQALVAQQNAVIDRKNQELQRQEAARLMMEQAAAEANRIVESIPQIAWTANPEGYTTYLNRRWFDYTGQPNTGTLSEQWKDYMHPDDFAPAMARWNHSLTTEEPYEVEYRFRDRAGRYRWMLGRGLPSRNNDGEIIQWIGTCTDIHEHKMALQRIDQAQRQLQENNEQLVRANVDLDNFIYTASHDLKAPISNIEGLLHALLGELPTPDQSGGDVEAILAMMQGSVDRFKRTIEHLTEVSKLQKAYGQAVEKVDLALVIEDVCLDLQPLIQTSGAQVTVDVRDCPQVLFLEKNLRSVVYNLLSNALKYRSLDRVADIRVTGRVAGSEVVLAVRDNGLGLSPGTEHRLFAMFQRFHDHVEGSGIGLYMVKKIVENSGGRIEVQSELGVGSTFTVYIGI